MQFALNIMGVTLKERKQGQLSGACPLHRSSNIKVEHTCFHVDAERELYHCFSCQAGGKGPVKLLMDYFGLQKYGQVHAMLSDKYGIQTDEHLAWKDEQLQPFRDYLRERRIPDEIAKKFNLSAVIKGKYRGRIKIPIFSDGKEVGTAYRTIKPDEVPKYLFNKGFERNQYLYALDMVPKDSTSIILTEGFTDVYRLVSYGIENVVSSMGCNVSERQQELLVQRQLPVTIMFDGDDAGYKASRKLESKLKERLVVTRIDLPTGKQPDDLSKSELEVMLCHE